MCDKGRELKLNFLIERENSELLTYPTFSKEPV